MFSKNEYDENPDANLESEIKKRVILNQEKEEVLLHNNFGICSQ